MTPIMYGRQVHQLGRVPLESFDRHPNVLPCRLALGFAAVARACSADNTALHATAAQAKRPGSGSSPASCLEHEGKT